MNKHKQTHVGIGVQVDLTFRSPEADSLFFYIFVRPEY
jgi:hypothetical protein